MSSKYEKATDKAVVERTKQKRKKKSGGVVNRLITVIAVLVLLVAGGICVKYFHDIYESKKQAQNIADLTTQPMIFTFLSS